MVFIFGLLLLSGLWSTGIFKDLFAGPKTPLPRGAVNLQLGLSLDQVLQLYPLMNLGDVFKEYPGMTIDEIAKKHSKVRKNLDQLKRTLRPFNGDPDKVEPAPNARALLDRLRAAGLPLAVVSNQSGVGRGYITLEQSDAVNRRVEELLGPFGGFFVCPHAPQDDCDCRKPKPKLVLEAARALGVEPGCCVVVGDRESDVQAARNAGAIPLRIEGPHELRAAVERILRWREGVEE